MQNISKKTFIVTTKMFLSHNPLFVLSELQPDILYRNFKMIRIKKYTPINVQI